MKTFSCFSSEKVSLLTPLLASPLKHFISLPTWALASGEGWLVRRETALKGTEFQRQERKTRHKTGEDSICAICNLAATRKEDPATTQNLVVKFDGEICGGVLVEENASDDFPQQKKLEKLLPTFAGSSPPISPKTSPTSLWKSLVLKYVTWLQRRSARQSQEVSSIL